jgi:hypothetical protein
MRLPCIGGAFETYPTRPSPICVEIVSRYDGVAVERLIDEVDGLRLAAALVQMRTGRDAIQLLNLAEVCRPGGAIGVLDEAFANQLRSLIELSSTRVEEMLTDLLADWPDPTTQSDPLEVAKGLASWLKDGGSSELSARAIHIALEAYQANIADNPGDVLWWTAAGDGTDENAELSITIASSELQVTRSIEWTRTTAAELRSIRLHALKPESERRGEDARGFSVRLVEVGSGDIDTAPGDYRVVLLFSILQAAASHLVGGRGA